MFCVVKIALLNGAYLKVLLLGVSFQRKIITTLTVAILAIFNRLTHCFTYLKDIAICTK